LIGLGSQQLRIRGRRAPYITESDSGSALEADFPRRPQELALQDILRACPDVLTADSPYGTTARQKDIRVGNIDLRCPAIPNPGPSIQVATAANDRNDRLHRGIRDGRR